MKMRQCRNKREEGEIKYCVRLDCWGGGDGKDGTREKRNWKAARNGRWNGTESTLRNKCECEKEA